MTYEVTVKDQSNAGIAFAETRIDILDDGRTFVRTSDGNGYTNIGFVPVLEAALLSVRCDGYKTHFEYITTTSEDQKIDVVLQPFNNPASWRPAQEAYTNIRGAFCIPNAVPGIPYGDNKRIWTPAFGCYSGSDWQTRIIEQTKNRNYNWFEYQLSGKPYHDDYPELELDVDRIVYDLNLLHRNQIGTFIAFDDRILDLSYLAPVAARTQKLVDFIWGIYELNGVVNWNEDEVIRILKAQHELWPDAHNGFHSTSQDNGGRGFGERPFWLRAVNEAHVRIYLLQQAAWTRTLESTADRATDFGIRLQGPHAQWIQLEDGMCLAEETTTVTYRTEPESYGVSVMNQLMGMVHPRPIGYMDGGSV